MCSPGVQSAFGVSMAVLLTCSLLPTQLAGNFVKNTRKPAICTTPPDIKVSMSADPVSSSLPPSSLSLSSLPPFPPSLPLLSLSLPSLPLSSLSLSSLPPSPL